MRAYSPGARPHNQFSTHVYGGADLPQKCVAQICPNFILRNIGTNASRQAGNANVPGKSAVKYMRETDRTMKRTLTFVGLVLVAVTAPIRLLLRIILGFGALLALVGTVGTLFGAGVLHLLSPNTSVVPLLRLAGIATLGWVVLFAASCVPGVAFASRR